ncbi:MAG: hypothetical protein J7K94_00920, partial [Dehalococcoidia bacterium]|nr:hypothetical protein [Dehalococcoidia bacterium]
MNKRAWYKKAVYLLVALSLLLPLGIAMGPLSTVGAEEPVQYNAGQIGDWLIDQVEGSSITHTSPTVALNCDDAHTMTVNVSGTVGKAADSSIEVALNHVVFTFDGSLDVKVNGQISALGLSPKFGQGGNDIEVTVACASGGSPRVTAISNINIAGFTPSLSSGDLDKIADVLTQAIEASGLTVDSLGGKLTGLDVVDDSGTAKLQFTWKEGGTVHTVKWDAAAVVSKLNDALDSLETQGEDYLLNGRAQEKWDLGVAIADNKLTLSGHATMFGLTASADSVDIT